MFQNAKKVEYSVVYGNRNPLKVITILWLYRLSKFQDCLLSNGKANTVILHVKLGVETTTERHMFGLNIKIYNILQVNYCSPSKILYQVKRIIKLLT